MVPSQSLGYQCIEFKTSKHEFTVRIHQNKHGFKVKKLSEGREGIRCVSRTCAVDVDDSATGKHIFLLFSYLDFRVYFACYLPESFTIICLTCIWSKFVDTSFYSSQNPQQNSRLDHHFYQLRESQNSPEAGTRHIMS